MQIEQQEPTKRLSHKQRLAQAPALKDAGAATPTKRTKNVLRRTAPDERIFLRVLAAAQALDCSRQRVYELLRLGELPFVRLGGSSIRVPKAAIDKLVAEAMDK